MRAFTRFRRGFTAGSLAACALVAACSHPKPAAVAPPRDLVTPRLAAADDLMRAGCLECLVKAYDEYHALASEPAAADRAAVGAVRAAALVALRELELGMADEGYLQRARDAAAGRTDLPPVLLTILDVVAASAPANVGAGRPTSDADLEKMRLVRTNQAAWSDVLRASADTDLTAAYTWLSFMCGSSDSRALSRDDLLAVVSSFDEVPLIEYRKTACRTIDGPGLEARQKADARFVEVEYYLGSLDVAKRDLDGADARFARAYQWHPRWPTLTLAMANVAMTLEEFERALARYDDTLALEPHAVDALLGRIKALTYLGRHEQAIAAADALIAEGWYVGDGRFWRAFNQTELARYDEAWTEIELAAKLLLNADVPKLAGIIAYRRHELDVSRAKFELARSRSRLDCETGFYLGVVLAELRQWPQTAEILTDTATCLQNAEQRTREEIDQIQASKDPPERKARKIARREQLLAAGRRMLATSWFDTAVAYYNLSRNAEAREYAEKVAADEQFGERAREILARVNKTGG